MRIKIFKVSSTAILLLLALVLGYIQIVKGDYYYKLSEQNYIRLLPQSGRRGIIYDRNHKILADNRLSFNLICIPQELKNRDSVFERLSRILEIDRDILDKAYKSRYLNPFTPLVLVRDIKRTHAMLIEEEGLSRKGIIVEPIPLRSYLHDSLLSHTIGHLGLISRSRYQELWDYGYRIDDLIGYTGIEELYEDYLRPKEGGMQIEVDNQGRQVRLLGYKKPEAGKNLVLNIDIRFQRIAENVLGKRPGTIIVMSPYSGEILALANEPDYNPNIFITNLPQEPQDIAGILSSKEAPLLNRGISGMYPLGSIFKIVVAMAGLEGNKINQYTKFSCEGSLKVGDREFYCWRQHGSLDLTSAIAESCNVYFYNLGLLVGADVLSDFAFLFGLGQKTNIDLLYENRGFVPTKLWKRKNMGTSWFLGDTVNLSIGQGYLLTTPVQVVRLMAIFANGGYMVTPYLVRSKDGVDVLGAQPVRAPFKNKNVNIIKNALRETVKNPSGTAHALNNLEISVAGKTATSQTKGKSHAWFAGFAPFKQPRIVFCVFLEHGGSSYNAVILTKELLREFLREGLL